MPKKYHKKRTVRRRRPRAKRGNRRTGGGLSSAFNRTMVISDRTYIKLTYSELGALTYGGAGTAAAYQYISNALYDPNYTGGGHQPLGFDQWAAFYNKYRVYGMKYTITFTNQSSTYWADIALLKRPTATLPVSMSQTLEQPYTQKGCLAPIGSGRCLQVMKGYVSNRKVLGVSKAQFDADDTFAAAVNSNPSNGVYFSVLVMNQNAASTMTVNFRADLVFYACMYDRVNLSQS
nr:MAG: putative capsid protein [Arizlama virus]